MIELFSLIVKIRIHINWKTRLNRLMVKQLGILWFSLRRYLAVVILGLRRSLCYRATLVSFGRWITSWPDSRIFHWSKSSFYWQRQLQFPNAQLSRDQFSFVPMEIKSNRMAGGTRWSTCVLVCFSWLLDYPWFISNWEDSNCTA